MGDTMPLLSVKVLLNGRVLKTIERPGHSANGGYEVVYRKQRYRVAEDGSIDIGRAPGRSRAEAVRSAHAVGIAAELGAGAAPSREFLPDQRQEAVITASPDARIIVEAGPGTGKTAVACARVAHLLSGYVEPSGIWLISFTRTAIAEVRDRIEAMAESVAAASAVRITTIDSQAWQLRQGFEVGASGQPFKSYEESIEGALRMLERPGSALKDYLETIEHLIIDETQDVVGPRAELILALIRALPTTCGVTVFCDPAQAIYGFSEDDQVGRGAITQLTDILLKDASLGFRELQLTEVYRTANPALRRIFTETRRIVLERPGDSVRKVLESIAANASGTVHQYITEQGIAGRPDILVLFRRRAEVLFSGSFLADSGAAFRVRMSGLPVCLPPLIGGLFHDFKGHTLDRAALEILARARAFGRVEEVMAQLWPLLLRYAGTPSGAVSMRRLREVLSQARPPVEFAMPDLGSGGPILGTIHASKGREADCVHLMLAKAPAAEVDDEELRVIYVGATRARRELKVGIGTSFGMYSHSTGRAYRPVRAKGRGLPGVQVEFGRDGDIDESVQVARSFCADPDEVRVRQAWLYALHGAPVRVGLRSEQRGGDWIRVLIDDGGRSLAQLTPKVGQDLMRIAATQGDRVGMKLRPPSTVRNLFLLGARTVVMPMASPDLARFHEPWATSGFYLVPILFGFPKLTLHPY